MAFSPPTTWNNGLATSGSSSWLADCDRWVSRKLQWSDCDLGRAWLEDAARAGANPAKKASACVAELLLLPRSFSPARVVHALPAAVGPRGVCTCPSNSRGQGDGTGKRRREKRRGKDNTYFCSLKESDGRVVASFRSGAPFFFPLKLPSDSKHNTGRRRTQATARRGAPEAAAAAESYHLL